MSETDPETIVRTGFFPIVSATSVEMEQAGAAAVVARGDVSITNAGANIVLANGTVSIANGGAQTLLANGDVDIQHGGTLVAGAKHVEVHGGWVGVALARRVDLTDSKLLLGPRSALFLGIGLAVGRSLVIGARRYGRRE
jgi:hypothetical protein